MNDITLASHRTKMNGYRSLTKRQIQVADTQKSQMLLPIGYTKIRTDF